MPTSGQSADVGIDVVQDAAVRTKLLLVVVSGLAASGKTSVAEPLARAFGLRLLSKDGIKESLFASLGYGGWEWSKSLSRAADAARASLTGRR